MPDTPAWDASQISQIVDVVKLLDDGHDARAAGELAARAQRVARDNEAAAVVQLVGLVESLRARVSELERVVAALHGAAV